MSSELYLGENTALDVVVTPDDATYQDASYTSSNEFVVVCKNNQMIAVGEGTATITANSVLIWKKLLPKTEVLTYRLKIKKWHLL